MFLHKGKGKSYTNIQVGFVAEGRDDEKLMVSHFRTKPFAALPSSMLFILIVLLGKPVLANTCDKSND